LYLENGLIVVEIRRWWLRFFFVFFSLVFLVFSLDEFRAADCKNLAFVC